MASDIYSALAASQTPQNLYFRRMLEEGTNSSPIQSWTQGASRMAHALLAGMAMRGQGDEEGQKFDTMFGLKPGAPVPVADAASAQPAVPPIAAALAGRPPERAYDQSERNPLDLPAGPDRDLMIRAIHGEAGNQGPEGQRAVASVMRNRAANGGFGGDTLPGVIRAPNQFEAVNTPAGQQRMAALPAGSPQYDAIGKTVDQAYAGNDPTNGATNFFAPKAQAALGREVPAWAKGPGQDIGDHRFFGAPQQPQQGQQTAQADPAALPPNATQTQGYAIPGQPQGQPQPGQRQAPQIPPDVLTRARAMWMSGDPTMKQAGIALLQPYLGPKDQEQPIITPEERARAGIPATDTRPYQRNTVTNKISSVDNAPTITMQANTAGETEYSKGKAQDALGLERSADKTMQERQQLQVFKSLVQDFKTGKLAPAQMTAGAWADAIGIDPKTMEKFGVPANAAVNGQLIESLSNQMTLGMIGTKGGEGGSMPANNFSDADRKFLQNTVPGLARVQGGNLVLAEIKQRGLDRQLDKISMWDDYRSQGKKFEDFERDWRAKVRSEPSLFADIPDMVRAQSAPPQAGGAAPQGAPSIDDLVKKYGPK